VHPGVRAQFFGRPWQNDYSTSASSHIRRAVSSASASVILAPTIANGFRPGRLTDQQAFAGAAERLVSVDPALSADSVIT